MRNLVLAIILFTISNGTSVLAQNGSIRGLITDRATNEKIPYANIVAVFKSDTGSPKGTVSDKDGMFGIDNLPYGNYNIVISFIGYKSDTIKNIGIDRQNQHVNLGEVQLSTITVSLGVVVVEDRAETTSSKLDRVTYRTGDFETAKGGNAADVLNKLPSVSVDPDGVISVRGTTDFMIYLNG